MRVLKIVAMATLVTACSTPEPPPPPKATYSMQTPKYLTEEARQKLRASMGVHREAMAGLFNALLVLDREGVNRYAAALESQPRMVQDPKLPKDERIPDRVFELQDELHQRAHDLAKLVNSEEAIKTGELAGSFANLAKVCVTCHTHYLYPEQ
jgi:cytochrome c556